MRRKNQDAYNAAKRKKYAEDLAYRNKVKQQASDYHFLHYYSENGEYRKKQLNSHIKIKKELPIEKLLFRNIEASAKRRNIEFNLSIDDIFVPKNCPHCGIELRKYIGEKRRGPDAYSIDRIDSSRGYVKGNIQVVCWRANHLKSDGTLEEFEKLVDWLKNVQISS